MENDSGAGGAGRALNVPQPSAGRVVFPTPSAGCKVRAVGRQEERSRGSGRVSQDGIRRPLMKGGVSYQLRALGQVT